MKTKDEILERLEYLDGSHVPQERGGYREKATIRALLWMLDEPEAYTTHGRSVYVDRFTADNEEVRLVCSECGGDFDELPSFQKHVKADHEWDTHEDRPSLRQERVVVDE